MLCWAVYSVGSRRCWDATRRPVLTAWRPWSARRSTWSSPRRRTGRHGLVGVSWWSWFLMAASSIVCLCVLAYVTGTLACSGWARPGPRPTATSRRSPRSSSAGCGWAGAVHGGQSVGAAAILGGVFLTRWSPVVVTPRRDTFEPPARLVDFRPIRLDFGRATLPVSEITAHFVFERPVDVFRCVGARDRVILLGVARWFRPRLHSRGRPVNLSLSTTRPRFFETRGR